MGKHKQKFTDAELQVLVNEVTRHQNALNSSEVRETYKIWFYIAKQVSKTSGLQRSMGDVKQRWLALKGLPLMKRINKVREKNAKIQSSLSPGASFSPVTEVDHEAQMLTVAKRSDNCQSICSSSEGEITKVKINMDLQFADDECQFPLEYPDSHLSPQLTPEAPPPCSPPPHPETQVSVKIEAPEMPEIGQLCATPKRRCSVSTSQFPSLSPFEEQLLAVHREQTAAIREGFRTLAHHNQLLYVEVCDTNRNVARIASVLADKAAGSARVAEELIRVQQKISQSLDATSNLHSRVVDFLCSSSSSSSSTSSSSQRALPSTPRVKENKSPPPSEQEGSLGKLIQDKKFDPVVTFWP